MKFKIIFIFACSILLSGCFEKDKSNSNSTGNIHDVGYVVKIDDDQFLFTSKSMITLKEVKELNTQTNWNPVDSLTWEQRQSSVWLPIIEAPKSLTVGDEIEVSYYTQLDSNPQFGGFDEIKIISEN
ncbi:hypothetical protein [Sporosarcina sp. Te-1]|uniref:hypothetical protein n=1 Tax=Sporosarcina sp. Te-1 TaxID=2818390 RepID=UPI001A9DCD6C|nr:hypothetical protein [Sporosarcina sp. Te-1]QTD39467.1 hypothetical protein J3U78_11340 [Sporosarcina sp. Te-1]